MKSGIHPEIMNTKVHCNGCGIDFETRATVPEVTVEICSNCHPFYTGKQKLVDTAGRVEKFKQRTEAAQKRREDRIKRDTAKAEREAEAARKNDPEMEEIAEDLESHTVDQPQAKANDKVETTES